MLGKALEVAKKESKQTQTPQKDAFGEFIKRIDQAQKLPAPKAPVNPILEGNAQEIQRQRRDRVNQAGTLEFAMARVDMALGLSGENRYYDPTRRAILSALWGNGHSAPKMVPTKKVDELLRKVHSGKSADVIAMGEKNRFARTRRDQAIANAQVPVPEATTGVQGVLDRLQNMGGDIASDFKAQMDLGEEQNGWLGRVGGAASATANAARQLFPTQMVQTLAEGAAGGGDFRADPERSAALKLGAGAGNLAEYFAPVTGAAKIGVDALGLGGRMMQEGSPMPLYRDLVQAPIEAGKTVLDPNAKWEDRVLGGATAAAAVLGAYHGAKKVGGVLKAGAAGLAEGGLRSGAAAAFEAARGGHGPVRDPAGEMLPQFDRSAYTDALRAGEGLPEYGNGAIDLGAYQPADSIAKLQKGGTQNGQEKGRQKGRRQEGLLTDPGAAVETVAPLSVEQEFSALTKNGMGPNTSAAKAIYDSIPEKSVADDSALLTVAEMERNKVAGPAPTMERIKPPVKPDLESKAPAVQDPKNLVSKSGRKLAPYPDVPVKNARVMRTQNEWLLREALNEAVAAGDEFNADQFRHELASGPSKKMEPGWPPATIDAADLYLFGDADGVRFERGEDKVKPRVGQDAMIGDNPQANPKRPLPIGVAPKPGDVSTQQYEKGRGVDAFSKLVRGEGVPVREGSQSAKAMGSYQGPTPNAPQGKITLRTDAEIGTRGHEAAHALDALTNPTGKTGRKVWQILNLGKGDAKTIDAEMRAVTDELVGSHVARGNPKYYYSQPEMWARFLHAHIEMPALVDSYAPTAKAALDVLAAKDARVGKYLEVASGKPLERKSVAIVPDRKQEYIKALGTHLGTKAWHAEEAYFSRRAKTIEEFQTELKNAQKNVPDSGEALMTAAEGIRTNESGVMEFGTHDRITIEDKAVPGYEEMGWEAGESKGGMTSMSKVRQTPEEAKANYEALSPAGKRLIDQYTRDTADAEIGFNRNVDRVRFKIEGDQEGYVPRVLRENRNPVLNQWKKLFLQQRKAKSSKARTVGTGEGEVRDFWKQVEASGVDARMAEEWNSFINKQLARVAEPVPIDENFRPAPRKGWTIVEGNLKRGFQEPPPLRQEHPPVRYYVPNSVWDAYQNGMPGHEPTAIARIAGKAGQFWMKVQLSHPGSIARNAASGATQFSLRMLEDAYLDAMGHKGTRNRTEANMRALLGRDMQGNKARGPEWMHGGKQSSYMSIFEDISRGGVWDQIMVPYQKVESFWKKVISQAELNKRGITAEQAAEFDQILGEINDAIDVAAYNYHNIPTWFAKSKRGWAASLVKPFSIYPYKAFKQFVRPFEMMFDGNYSRQEKAASLMALGTVVSLYIAAKRGLNSQAETDTTTGDDLLSGNNRRLQARGSIYAGKSKSGREAMVGLSYLTPLQYADAIDGLLPRASKDGKVDWMPDFDQLTSILSDQIGGMGPLATAVAAPLGIRSKYDSNKETGTILGQAAGSFIPGSRIIRDLNSLAHPEPQRNPQSFLEAVRMNLPGLDDRPARKNEKPNPDKRKEDIARLLGLRLKYVDPEAQRLAIARAKQRRRQDR